MASVLIAVAIALPAFATHPANAAFTPEAGFGGRSEGTGTLKLLFGKERPYHVASYGRTLDDGTFRLDQTVWFKGEPTKYRHWILHSVRPDHYAGLLSDAAGAVTGDTDGSRLVLRYRVKGPLIMHQTLDMMADGTIDNVGTITVLGIPVGHLQETIVRKKPDA